MFVITTVSDAQAMTKNNLVKKTWALARENLSSVVNLISAFVIPLFDSLVTSEISNF